MSISRTLEEEIDGLVPEEDDDDMVSSLECIKALNKKIFEQNATIEELKNDALYKRAEFDNYRKRTQKEIATIRETACKNLVIELLEVVDDAERARNEGEMPEGVELVFTKLLSKLKNIGLERINSDLCTDFNPDTEEAVGTAENADLAGKVIQTVSNGYTLNGNVIRFAKVIVGR